MFTKEKGHDLEHKNKAEVVLKKSESRISKIYQNMTTFSLVLNTLNSLKNLCKFQQLYHTDVAACDCAM